MDEDDSIGGKDKTCLGKGADASPQPKQQPYVYFYSSRSLVFCWVLWCMHSAWNSNAAVYSSLCTLPAVKCFMLMVARFGFDSVHFYTDKSAGDLLWTNLRVIWEYPYSDQWEHRQYNLHEPHWPIKGSHFSSHAQTHMECNFMYIIY